MKVIEITSCEKCPYFVPGESYWNEPYCKNRSAPEFNTIVNSNGIPDWCPLVDIRTT